MRTIFRISLLIIGILVMALGNAFLMAQGGDEKNAASSVNSKYYSGQTAR